MKRQFFIFYIAITLVLAAAAVTFYFTAQRNFELALDQRLADSMASTVELVQQKFTETGDDAEKRAEVFEELSSPYRLSQFYRRRGGPERGDRERREPPRESPENEVAESDEPGAVEPEKRDENRKGPQGRDGSRRSRFSLTLELAQQEALDFDDDERDRLASGGIVILREADGIRKVCAEVGQGEVAVIGSFSSRRRPGPDFDISDGMLLILAPPLAILLLVGVAVYFLIRPIERRILALAEVTKSFGEGDLRSRVQVGRTGSVDELEQSFNWMAGRIEQLVAGQQDLLRAVSHDLRTPLARLFFALDDARTAESTDAKNEHFERIDRSLVELSELVEELLIYLRLDENTLKPEKDLVDLSSVLHDAAALVSDLRPELSLETDCGQGQVWGDPRYVKRAVVNLVTNAVRHARSAVWITCTEGEGSYSIAVHDDGTGIPAEARDKIFEPFFRVDESRTGNLGGTGLGLAIVARILAWHNGGVTVDDSTHGGACFTLDFPAESKSA